jgi:hypothetical protein
MGTSLAGPPPPGAVRKAVSAGARGLSLRNTMLMVVRHAMQGALAATSHALLKQTHRNASIKAFSLSRSKSMLVTGDRK